MEKIHLTTILKIIEKDGDKKIVLHSGDPEEAGRIKYMLEKGDRDTLLKIVGRDGKEEIVTYSPQLYSLLKREGIDAEYRREKDIDTLKAIEAAENRPVTDAKTYLAKLMETYTTERLKDEMTNKDMLVIHAINAYDEYTETINIFYERLREWYGIYFPELANYVKKIDRYASLVRDLLLRENMKKETLIERGYPENKAAAIEEAARNSTGGMLSREDLEVIRKHAATLLDLIKQREEVEKYLEELLTEEAPNTTHLIGHKLAARLIAKAGGLRRLATLPASTIQLLGAEKSLFIALRKGGKPPKHGIIFQHPFINQSPKVIRGRVARLLAGKIAIAARVDAFGGDFIGDRLLKEVEEKVEELRKKASKIKQKKIQMMRRQKQKRGRRRRRR